MEGVFKFLGTSGSMGVPVIGCKCSVCRSVSIKNQRMRCAGLLQLQDKNLLIDAGPEIRLQLLKYKIDRMDGVMITHAHYDHIGGIDDLKAFYFLNKTKIPLLLSSQTWEELSSKYSYLMDLFFDPTILEDRFSSLAFAGIPLECLGYEQNGVDVTGFKVGNLVYLSDIKQYSDKLLQRIQNPDILIISALRFDSSPMHFNINEAISFAKQIGAQFTYLTHLAHEVDVVKDHLPPNVYFAYDGLELSFHL